MKLTFDSSGVLRTINIIAAMPYMLPLLKKHGCQSNLPLVIDVARIKLHYLCNSSEVTIKVEGRLTRPIDCLPKKASPETIPTGGLAVPSISNIRSEPVSRQSMDSKHRLYTV
jgi:hypothetical protein